MTPDRIVDLERTARASLPATREIATPGWVIRVSGGTTKRVNSANPTQAGAVLDDVIDAAEAAYAAQGQPSRFRLTPLAAADGDGRLADRGYETIDESWTMVAPLVARTVDPAVTFAATIDPDWLTGLATASGWTVAQREAHGAILAAMPVGSEVATLVEDGRAVAFGVAGLAFGRVCLCDIMVVADRRGAGLGRRLVGSMLGHAQAAGHGEAMLQVLGTNTPARRLYASLGFGDAYRYHYRVRR